MTKTLLSIFEDRVDAEKAINSLEDNGFSAKDISIIMQDKAEAQDLGDSTGANVTGGAVTGATTGGIIGGLAGLLIGIGAIAVPGVGALLIGGPLAAALGLTGAAAATATGAVTGAVAGGLLGALMGLGVPEQQARVYETRVKEGAILLAVPVTEDSQADAMDILRDFGADQINEIEHDRADAYAQETMSHRYVREKGRSDTSSRVAFGAKGGYTRRKG